MILRPAAQSPFAVQITALEREIGALRDKRRGIETAIRFREEKLNRLKSQQVLAASPGIALPLAPCFA